MRIIIVLPTYNEKDNIYALIECLQREFKKLPHDMSILVVDDDSPDGTAHVVAEIQRLYANVFLLTGKKKGLGAAYIRGMTYALNTLEADALIQMDADFSHKCEDVARLIQALEDGADLVIGSRYVQGGKIPDNWGLIRVMNSRWGNRAARYIAALHNVRDCTAGFRIYRASLLKKFALTDVNVQGYAFQVALLNKAVKNGAIIKEIPVEFVDRTMGESKLGLKDILEFILNVWWIRYTNSKAFFKFLTVGAIGTVINLFSFTLMLTYGVIRFVASPVAVEISIISNHILDTIFTHGHTNTKYSLDLKNIISSTRSMVLLAVSYSTFVLLSVLFSHGIPQLHQFIGIIPATIINYSMNSRSAVRH